MRRPAVTTIADSHMEAATDLLCRFFREEGFAGDREMISANLNALSRDAHHWAAVGVVDGRIAGIVTVTTMLYVEWGRLGEIGDLYVLPEARSKGIGGALVRTVIGWCRSHGCSAVALTITHEGEARHNLSRFYARFGFTLTDRMSSILRFEPVPRG
jgi:GNAT superfamily N-acetyltransferase